MDVHRTRFTLSAGLAVVVACTPASSPNATDAPIARSEPCTLTVVRGTLRIAAAQCRPSAGMGWFEAIADPQGGVVAGAYGGSDPEKHADAKLFMTRVDGRLEQTWAQLVNRVEWPLGFGVTSGRIFAVTAATFEGRVLVRLFDARTEPPPPSSVVVLDRGYGPFGLASDPEGRLFTRVGDTHQFAILDRTGARIGGGDLVPTNARGESWTELPMKSPVTTRVARAASGRIAFVEKQSVPPGATARMNVAFVDASGAPPIAIPLPDGFQAEAAQLASHPAGIVVASREIGIRPTRENVFPIPGRLTVALTNERGVFWTKRFDVPADTMLVTADARGIVTVATTCEDHATIGAERVSLKKGVCIVRLDARGELVGWLVLADPEPMTPYSAINIVTTTDGHAVVIGEAFHRLWMASLEP